MFDKVVGAVFALSRLWQRFDRALCRLWRQRCVRGHSTLAVAVNRRRVAPRAGTSRPLRTKSTSPERSRPPLVVAATPRSQAPASLKDQPRVGVWSPQKCAARSVVSPSVTWCVVQTLAGRSLYNNSSQSSAKASRQKARRPRVLDNNSNEQ